MIPILPTRIHGMMDYLMGALLALAPFVFRFGAGPQTMLPVLLGLGMIAVAVFTDYELGMFRLIPMPAHLVLDAVVGLLLAVSPWLFGFAHIIWMPHVVLGLLEMGSAAITQTRPLARPSRAGSIDATM